jgi:ribosome-associated translation inhibitor RaiA
MGSTPDPMEPLRILSERAIDALNKVGFSVQNIAFLPNLEGGPHFAQIVVSLDPDTMSQTVEDDTQKQADDDVIKQLERQMLKDKEDEKAQAAQQGLIELQRKLEGGKGILDDDS